MFVIKKKNEESLYNHFKNVKESKREQNGLSNKDLSFKECGKFCAPTLICKSNHYGSKVLHCIWALNGLFPFWYIGSILCTLSWIFFSPGYSGFIFFMISMQVFSAWKNTNISVKTLFYICYFSEHISVSHWQAQKSCMFYSTGTLFWDYCSCSCTIHCSLLFSKLCIFLCFVHSLPNLKLHVHLKQWNLKNHRGPQVQFLILPEGSTIAVPFRTSMP